MKAIYKLKKKHITLILTKKADSKILKGNTLLQPVRWQASPIPTKKMKWKIWKCSLIHFIIICNERKKLRRARNVCFLITSQLFQVLPYFNLFNLLQSLWFFLPLWWALTMTTISMHLSEWSFPVMKLS